MVSQKPIKGELTIGEIQEATPETVARFLAQEKARAEAIESKAREIAATALKGRPREIPKKGAGAARSFGAVAVTRPSGHSTAAFFLCCFLHEQSFSKEDRALRSPRFSPFLQKKIRQAGKSVARRASIRAVNLVLSKLLRLRKTA